MSPATMGLACGLTFFTVAELLTPGEGNASGSCAGLNTIPEDLPDPICRALLRVGEIADIIRAEAGIPLRIVSGYRSPAYNRCIGGAAQSYHLRGMALDLQPLHLSPATMASLLAAATATRARGLWTGGLGVYRRFVHIDTRARHATW